MRQFVNRMEYRLTLQKKLWQSYFMSSIESTPPPNDPQMTQINFNFPPSLLHAEPNGRQRSYDKTSAECDWAVRKGESSQLIGHTVELQRFQDGDDKLGNTNWKSEFSENFELWL